MGDSNQFESFFFFHPILGILACYDLLNALRDPEAPITSHENMCTWLILERKQHTDNIAELKLQVEGPKDKVLEIIRD